MFRTNSISTQNTTSETRLPSLRQIDLPDLAKIAAQTEQSVLQLEDDRHSTGIHQQKQSKNLLVCFRGVKWIFKIWSISTVSKSHFNICLVSCVDIQISRWMCPFSHSAG